MKEATPPSSIAAPLGFTLNGTAVTVPVPDPDVTALDVLRDRLGRTEVKRVCDGGACGACTVLLGEAPVVTCLLPAARLAGSAVRTVAGLGPDLHPVQRALLDHDGLQCGFCTPGFVMSAVGFVDSWRASRGDVRPGRDTVAEALAGNLCRCGAYAGILTAVAEACTGRYDTDPDTAEQPTRNGARARVTGQARYTADLLGDGVLRGGLVRSERAHARIGEVDLGPARRLPGVFAAVELVQPDRVVRHHGQEIAAVAAVDTATLRRALDLVRVTYQPLPAVVGRQAPGGPAVYPPKHRGVPRTGEATLPVPARRRGNLYGPVRVFSRRRRRAARLLRERAGHYVAGVWTTSGQSHTPFEPHCCVAEWDGDRLTVHTSTQMVGMAARLLARHCSVPDANVTVLAEHVGGGFGAKLEITPETVAAVELARVARRPVGVVLDRAEELAYGGQRSAAEIEVDLLAAPEPERSALRVRAMSYGGTAVGSQVASLCRSSYPRLAKDLQDFNVVDNSPPAKPFRGPGGPVMCWALEQAVDEAAYGMGADPVDLRYGWTDDPAMRRLYQTARTQPRWRDRPPPGTARGRVRRGIGVAAAHWVYYAHADTRIRVSVVDGCLVAATATQDTGTGAASVVRHVLAGRFGVGLDRVRLELGDSRLPPGPLTGGSAGSASLAPAAADAAGRLQAALAKWCTAEFGLFQARPASEGVVHRDGLIGWPELLDKSPELSAIGRRTRDRVPYRLSPLLTGGLAIGRGHTGAVMLAEVEVDVELGLVRVPWVWSGLSVGTVMLPELARSQCHGGVVQGVGLALFEEKVLHGGTGAALTTDFDHYCLPGIGDQPEVEVHFEESGFGYSASPGVGLAELATLPVAAAIGNAVHHATGWRPRDLPLHPWRVTAGVRR